MIVSAANPSATRAAPTPEASRRERMPPAKKRDAAPPAQQAAFQAQVPAVMSAVLVVATACDPLSRSTDRRRESVLIRTTFSTSPRKTAPAVRTVKAATPAYSTPVSRGNFWENRVRD